MAKYDDLRWSAGYNQERHPENIGGDGLAFFLWNGKPGEDLDNATYGADEEENGGELVGYVYVDSLGRVSALFDGEQTDDKLLGGNIRAGKSWCEELNEDFES